VEKISIITPTFNRIKGLLKNIESVSEQTYVNKEHIIIDNLSDDGTQELVEKYMSEVSYHVVYIREQDFGIYSAMNKGIKVARGEWIHILNSDDYYVSGKSLELFFKEDISGFDIIAHPILIRNEKSGKIVSRWDPEYKSDINHYNFPHSGMIIKNNFYKLNSLYKENFKILSDAIFCLENIPKSKYKISKQPLAIMSDSGISNKFSFTRTKELIIFNFKYYKGPFKYKLKFTFLNIKRDLISILKDLKNNKLKRIK